MATKPPPPARHHMVPVFLTKRFTDANGLLHAAHTRGGTTAVFPSSPRNSFVERHWHTQILTGGARDISVEHALSEQIESPASIVVQKIIAAAAQDDLPCLSRDERRTWDSFFVNQRIRTRDHHRALGLYENFADQVDGWLLQSARRGRIIPADIANQLRLPENVERLKDNVRIQGYVRPLGEAMEVLSARGIAVVKLLGDRERFLVGSYPVVKLCPDDTNDLRDPRVEMWLPIASTIAVGTWGAAGTETIGRLDSDFASNINDAVAHQSSTIAGCSVQLVSRVLGRMSPQATIAPSP